MTNCVNCGAPLHGNKCEYCGTEYAGDQIVVDFDKDDCTGTISIGGKVYHVYLGNMTAEAHFVGAYRDIMGNLYRNKGRLIHTFTLIEF